MISGQIERAAHATIVMMCGLPASGKTTTAMRLHAQLGGVSFAKTLSARLIDLRSVWGLETLETATGPGVRVARGRPGGEKILGGTQNDPEGRWEPPA
jgi:hypothetical protein